MPGPTSFYHHDMPDYTIRHARDDEMDIVASLIVDAYAEYAAAMSPDAWSMFAQDIANVGGRASDGEIIVAERDQRVVGTVTVYRQWRGAQPGAMVLRLLAVPPDERGSGVGRALMQWCVDQARADGKSRVVITTMPDMVAMRELTDSMGFVRAPDLDHEPAPGVRAEGFCLEL